MVKRTFGSERDTVKWWQRHFLDWLPAFCWGGLAAFIIGGTIGSFGLGGALLVFTICLGVELLHSIWKGFKQHGP